MESSTMETSTTTAASKDGSNAGEGETTQLSPASEDGSSGCNDPGKMFIGGLSWQTTAEGLRDYFGKFGEVNECMVMRDPATKRARGFGFITFADPASVEKVLAHDQHELDGKKIDPKVAFPKRAQPKMIIKTKKVFIGGLSATSTLEDMRNYFEQYGKVEDAMLMFDKTTQRHRGFGFITFDNDDVSDKVCEIHFHEINGKMVECKKAQPKEVMLPVQLNKSRAAAARNLYGIGPEQLLAYASYLPRLGTYGANMLYPGGSAATLLPNTAASLVTATGNPYSYMFDAQKMDRLAGAARAQQSLQDLSQVFNGFQSYAPLAATSPPGSTATNSAANGGVARGFSVAAAQAAAAQQAVALEAAALYASVGGEAFPALYPPMHHQSAQMPHAFHKV